MFGPYITADYRHSTPTRKSIGLHKESLGFAQATIKFCRRDVQLPAALQITVARHRKGATMPYLVQPGCQAGGTPPFLHCLQFAARRSHSFQNFRLFRLSSIPNPIASYPSTTAHCYDIQIPVAAYHHPSNPPELVFISDFPRRCRLIAVAQSLSPDIQLTEKRCLAILGILRNRAGACKHGNT